METIDLVVIVYLLTIFISSSLIMYGYERKKNRDRFVIMGIVSMSIGVLSIVLLTIPEVLT